MGTRSRLLELDATSMRVLVAITLPGDGGGLAASPTRVVVNVDTSPRMLAFDSVTHRRVWSREVMDVRALAAGGGGSVWYLTGSGHVGHLDADGAATGREIDVHRVDPYDLQVTPLGPRVTFPGGYLDLRPARIKP